MLLTVLSLGSLFLGGLAFVISWTLFGLGVQIVFASFFLSVLGLRWDFVPESGQGELAGVPLDARVDQVQVLAHPVDGEP